MCKLTSLLFLLNVSFVPLAFTSEGEHTGINWWGLGSEYAHEPAIGWSFVTFLIFIGLIVWFARKPFSLYLQARAKRIKTAIEEAQLAKRQAEERVQEYEGRLKRLDAEIAQMKADFTKQGEKEKELILQAAKRLSEQIEKDVHDTIQAELRHAKTSLSTETAHLVVEAVMQKLSQDLLKDANTKLSHNFSRDLSTLPH